MEEDNRVKAVKEEQEKASWVAKGCPVFKYECGSKSKYSCEIKAYQAGRVEYNGVFIEAYKTCEK